MIITSTYSILNIHGIFYTTKILNSSILYALFSDSDWFSIYICDRAFDNTFSSIPLNQKIIYSEISLFYRVIFEDRSFQQKITQSQILRINLLNSYRYSELISKFDFTSKNVLKIVFHIFNFTVPKSSIL